MIVITGGGTGGHLAIANAVKDELNKQEIKPIFIGSSNGQDRAWFENDDGFEKCFFLPSYGVMNKGVFGKIKSLLNILSLSLKSKKILKKYQVRSVLSVGGYSAAPCSIATLISKTNLFIHEQNAVTGSLNKILKPHAKEFFSSYDENSKCKNYPIKDEFFQTARIRKETKTIIFLGGSQGAKDINDLAIDLADFLQEKNIKIIHQAGKRDLERVEKIYKEKSIEADLFDFDKNILEKIKSADCAIARSGAGTLFELTGNMIPSIFIPYPYAAGDHQYYNGKQLKDKELCKLYRKEEIDLEEIKEFILQDKEKISKKLGEFIEPNGAKCIAEHLKEL
ncbi:MAG: undecaprenyldiphospho-muramoylpentapeptide beta-N-acetylglucosaminyltransferase [Campylobacterales bacterium]|nr:undecaprenyldiphospho-muramoylpentapeptide beta-N-acetylglucosaminyltransferase [Campylobacterales bacterium]